jgi:ribosomal protein S18 acetylase RimI-like enzyme
LTGIITHPAYYRRGVASQLCRFFLDEGDKRGLPCILTGSPDGTPLYEKLGFVEKEEVIWRMKDGFVIRVEPVMIREPGSQS